MNPIRFGGHTRRHRHAFVDDVCLCGLTEEQFAERQRRSRSSRRKGKRGEKRVQQLAGGDVVGLFGGAEDNRRVLGAWTVQTKTGASLWPTRLASLLASERLLAAASGSAGPAVCFVEGGRHGQRGSRVIFACELSDLVAFIESQTTTIDSERLRRAFVAVGLDYGELTVEEAQETIAQLISEYRRLQSVDSEQRKLR